MVGNASAPSVHMVDLHVAAAYRKPEVGGTACTYDVMCSECSEFYERSRRATRYGFPFLCRACEIDSEYH
jgi:hypothetical protein